MPVACRNCAEILPPKKVLCQKCGEFTPNNEDTTSIASVTEDKTTTLDQVDALAIDRVKIGDPWDAVWGGGFVPGTTTLIGGSAGCGKTTSTLQMSSLFAKVSGRYAYFLSAEQAPGEIRLAAERILIDNLAAFRVMREFGAGADIDRALLKKHPPCSITLDSISGLCGRDNNAAVIVVRNMKRMAVEFKVPVFIICHMNKQADFAGLYTMQHDVDTIVTVFNPQDERVAHAKEREGYSEEVISGLKEMTAWKNRYGPTSKDHYVVMTPQGIRALGEPPVKEGRKKKGHIAVPATLQAAPEPEKPASDPPPSLPARKRPKPADEIVVDGQKLIRKDRKGRKEVGEKAGAAFKLLERLGERPSRAAAVEGEALKRKRAPMPKMGSKRRERVASKEALRAKAGRKVKKKPAKKDSRKEARA